MTVPLKRKKATKIRTEPSTIEEFSYWTIVTLYNTEIVIFNDYFVLLNTGGYKTVTTKRRMNQASEEFDLGFHVYQEKNVWYIDAGQIVRRKFMPDNKAILHRQEMVR